MTCKSVAPGSIRRRLLAPGLLGLAVILPAASLASAQAPQGEAAAAQPGAPDEFWARMAAPGKGESGFALKIALGEGGPREFLWVVSPRCAGEACSGVLANAPATLTTARQGDAVKFSPAAIVDWMYRRNGRIVGAATLREKLKDMTPGEAEAWRALLAEP